MVSTRRRPRPRPSSRACRADAGASTRAWWRELRSRNFGLRLNLPRPHLARARNAGRRLKAGHAVALHALEQGCASTGSRGQYQQYPTQATPPFAAVWFLVQRAKLNRVMRHDRLRNARLAARYFFVSAMSVGAQRIIVWEFSYPQPLRHRLPRRRRIRRARRTPDPVIFSPVDGSPRSASVSWIMGNRRRSCPP